MIVKWTRVEAGKANPGPKLVLATARGTYIQAADCVDSTTEKYVFKYEVRVRAGGGWGSTHFACGSSVQEPRGVAFCGGAV